MASTNVGSIHYDLKLDTDEFDRKSREVSSKLDKLGDRMTAFGKTMTASVTLPIAAGFGLAVKAASDLQETLNKVDVSFKDQAGIIREWSKAAISSMGIAQQTALDAAALFGDMSTAMGLNTKQAADMSKGLVQLAADMASFKNVSFERAQVALAGIYTGETEALKGLGIVMTESNLALFAQSRGITKSIQDMTQAEKVQLRYAYVMSVTTNAQGDFVRTSDSTANRLRTLRERFKELSAELGTQLLPIVNRFLEKLSEVLKRFSSLSEKQQQYVMTTAAVVAAIGPLLIIVGHLITALRVLAGVLAGPVGVALLALATLAAILINQLGGWRNALDVVTQGVKELWGIIGPFLMPSVWALVNTVRDQLLPALSRLWDTIAPVLVPVLKELGVILGATIVSAIWVLINALNVLARIIGYVISFMSNMRQWVQNVINAFNSLAAGVMFNVGQALQWLTGLGGRIRGAVGNLSHLLYDVGKSVIQGLINGIKDMAGSLAGVAKSIASSVKDTFTRALRIRSPSQVFAGYGQNIVAGLVMGIEKSMGSIVGSMKQMNITMAESMAPQQNQNISTSIYGNINIGSDADADRFLATLSRNQELAFRGVATRPGSVG